MNPIALRVTRIMDFGTIVSVIGVDLASDKPVVVHIDHRPFQAILDSWKREAFSQPIAFDAEHLVLTLDIAPDGDGDGGKKLSDAVEGTQRRDAA